MRLKCRVDALKAGDSAARVGCVARNLVELNLTARILGKLNAGCTGKLELSPSMQHHGDANKHSSTPLCL
jgi:hypothetical protein